MGDHQASARFQASTDFPQRAQPLASVEKVQREEARCAVEWTGRRLIDRPRHKIDAILERQDGLARKTQHGGRGIDPLKAPVRPRFGHGFDFQPTAGADDEGMGRIRSEAHTSELQSLMRISYAVFCLQNTTRNYTTTN